MKYDPAFPVKDASWQGHGMTVRAYVATELMWRPCIGRQGKEFLKARAEEAVAAADALIAELEKA